MKHSRTTNYFVPHGGVDEEKDRDPGLGGGMDNITPQRVPNRSATRPEFMTVNDPTDPEPGPANDPQHGLARKNRGILFSDPEWE